MSRGLLTIVVASASLAFGCDASIDGRVCSTLADCEDPADREFRYMCSVEHAFTCQSLCLECSRYGHEGYYCCPNGSACDPVVDLCPGDDVTPMDTCDASGGGCMPDERCRVTASGVRRCMRECVPEAGPCRTPGAWYACLPDPEVAGEFLCWLGGTTRLGDACTSSYECHHPYACGPDGVCAHPCGEDADCADLGADVGCADFVCAARAPATGP